MQHAPDTIDGATVVIYTSIDFRHRPTGACRQIVAGVLQGPAAGLAICQYRGDNSFYLFGCDESWQSKTDTWHQTLDEAMDQAEFEYEGVRKTWLNHQPAWEPMAEADENAVWSKFYKQFHFTPSTKPSDWPGIREPILSVTYDISHVFDPPETPSEARETEMNVEMLRLLRMCVIPGQRLYVLDWQHPCYWFNPYGRFEFSPFDNSIIPFIPNGDYYIFLADDLRFGTFGHPWEQTICVFGQSLLQIIERERPKLFGRIVRKDGRHTQ